MPPNGGAFMLPGHVAGWDLSTRSGSMHDGHHFELQPSKKCVAPSLGDAAGSATIVGTLAARRAACRSFLDVGIGVNSIVQHRHVSDKHTTAGTAFYMRNWSSKEWAEKRDICNKKCSCEDGVLKCKRGADNCYHIHTHGFFVTCDGDKAIFSGPFKYFDIYRKKKIIGERCSANDNCGSHPDLKDKDLTEDYAAESCAMNKTCKGFTWQRDWMGPHDIVTYKKVDGQEHSKAKKGKWSALDAWVKKDDALEPAKMPDEKNFLAADRPPPPAGSYAAHMAAGGY